MEFPFGHHHGHGHRRDEHGDEEEERRRYPPPGYQPPPPPPPASYYGWEDPYGRPPVEHVSHFSGGSEDVYGRPAFPTVQHVSHFGGDHEDDGRPPYPSVHHVSHFGGDGGRPSYPHIEHVSHQHHHHHGSGHEPPSHGGSSNVQHVSHESWEGERRPPSQQPTVRIFTKAEENFSLSIRDGRVVLVRDDPYDDYQHWIKDLRYSTKVKDEEGFPSFALINKVTGEALKHSIGATHPVRLIRYNPNYLDESVLWAESKDLGDGFRCIRMVNNIRLNFDAFHGDKNHGGVRDGTTLVLWEWLKGENQRWKIVPRCEFLDKPHPY